MRQKNKKILFIVEEGDGIARPLYRARIPAKGLKSLGWDAKCCPVLYEQENHTFNGWSPGEVEPTETPKFIVCHIFLSPKKGTQPGEAMELEWTKHQPIIETARVHGQKFFFDLDDDVWNVPEWNPAFGSGSGISAHLAEWTDDINSSDGLIVSTQSIAEQAAKHGITVPIHVIRNCVDVDRTNLYKREDHEPLRLGYIGVLDYRQKDFEVAIPELYKALNGRRNQVEFWHLGCAYEEEKISIRRLLKDFPVEIVERPWATPDKFREALKSIDIAILPALECTFNNGRSWVVGLELMAAGVPFLASPIDEYVQLEKQTSFLHCINWHNFTDGYLEYWMDLGAQNRFDWREQAHKELLNQFTPKHSGIEYQKVFEQYV